MNHLTVTGGGGGIINLFLFHRLDLNRNAAKSVGVIEISDPRMAKVY